MNPAVRCAVFAAFCLFRWQEAPCQSVRPASSQTAAALSILEFGGQPDTQFDNTDSFNAAVRAAASKSLTIEFPCGAFRFARQPEPIPSGIRLLGCGSVGSTPGYGSSLVADYNEPSSEAGFLTWDGSFKKGGNGCCAGTGGGIEKLSVYKGPGKNGGTAIKFTGVDDAHRAGYSTISDVLVSSISQGTWNHNLIIDGSCCKTLHAQGVRDTYINNFWAAQAVAPDQSILLRSAVQVFWHGGEIMAAGSGSSSGITITGSDNIPTQSANIFISDVYIAGDLIISHGRNILFRGLIGGDLIVDASASNTGVSGLVGGRITNHSSTASIETTRLISPGTAGQVVTPALSTGTGTATDLAGTCTTSGNKCLYVFKNKYAVHPICVANDESTGEQVKISYQGTTAAVFTTPGPNDMVDFICVARE